MLSGLTSTNELTARTARQMTEQADQVFVLTDNSKFDQKSFRTICSFKAIDAIITNRGVPAKYRAFLAENDVELIEVD